MFENGLKVRINDIFISMIMLLYYIIGITNFSFNRYASIALAVLVLIYCSIKASVPRKYKNIGILLVIFGFFNLVFAGNMSIPILELTICAYVFALAFVCLDYNENVLLLTCILFTIFVVVAVFNNRSTDDILAIASNNYLSIYILIPSIIFYCKQYQKGQNLSVIPIMCTLIVSFIGNGRSGILASLVLLAAYLIKTNGNRRFLFIMAAMAIVMVVYINEGNLFMTIFSRFVERGFDNTGRTEIWNSYFQGVDSIGAFFFGGKLENIPFIQLMGNNVHCSFISAHVYYGIIPAIFVLLVIAKNSIRLIKDREFFLLLILMCFVLRCLTDKVFLDDFAFGSFWLFFLYLWFDKYTNNLSRE